jgi:hypothetical protein
VYTGHVGLALGVRGLRQDVPLWALVLVAQGADWVEIILTPLGNRELVLVWSHAFPWVAISGAVAGALIWTWTRSRGAAITVCLLYLSHPLADYLTGFKVLWAGGPHVGLILIERPGLDFAIEAAICAAGWGLYLRSLAHPRLRAAAFLPIVFLLCLQGLGDLALQSRLQTRRIVPFRRERRPAWSYRALGRQR